MRHTASTKHIGLLALPGVQLLDLAGPMDIFAEANLHAGCTLYATKIISLTTEPLKSASGLRFLPDLTLSSPVNDPFDTVLIAGAPHLTCSNAADSSLLRWIEHHAPRARRFGSICTGAIPLAATGLIDHHRITTHWAVADQLAARYPTIKVEPDALFIRDRAVCTAAGVTAGMDLALALVREDEGHTLARLIASHLVMFFPRPGGQQQFSRHGITASHGHSVLHNIQRRVLAAPHERASTAHLAALAGLSIRHFTRLFRAETGQSPAAWVEQVRIEAARRQLEQGLPPKTVAGAVGFHDVDTFRRAFQRQLSISPADYRRRHGANQR